MKTTITILGIIAAITATSVIAKHTFAGPHSRSGQWDRPDTPRGFDRHDGGLGRSWKLMLALSKLDLSPQQSTEVREIFKSHMPKLVDATWPISQAKHKLSRQMHREPFDEKAVRNTADQLGHAVADVAVLRAQIHHAISEVLTPEQQQQLNQLRTHRRNHRGGACPEKRQPHDQPTEDQ